MNLLFGCVEGEVTDVEGGCVREGVDGRGGGGFGGIGAGAFGLGVVLAVLSC